MELLCKEELERLIGAHIRAEKKADYNIIHNEYKRIKDDKSSIRICRYKKCQKKFL